MKCNVMANFEDEAQKKLLGGQAQLVTNLLAALMLLSGLRVYDHLHISFLDLTVLSKL